MTKKLKGLKKDYPPAQASASQAKKPQGGENITVTTILPKSVIKQLRIKAAEEDTTIRVEILKALRSAGYNVDEAELIDRRK